MGHLLSQVIGLRAMVDDVRGNIDRRGVVASDIEAKRLALANAKKSLQELTELQTQKQTMEREKEDIHDRLKANLLTPDSLKALVRNAIQDQVIQMIQEYLCTDLDVDTTSQIMKNSETLAFIEAIMNRYDDQLRHPASIPKLFEFEAMDFDYDGESVSIQFPKLCADPTTFVDQHQPSDSFLSQLCQLASIEPATITDEHGHHITVGQDSSLIRTSAIIQPFLNSQLPFWAAIELGDGARSFQETMIRLALTKFNVEGGPASAKPADITVVQSFAENGIPIPEFVEGLIQTDVEDAMQDKALENTVASPIMSCPAINGMFSPKEPQQEGVLVPYFAADNVSRKLNFDNVR